MITAAKIESKGQLSLMRSKRFHKLSTDFTKVQIGQHWVSLLAKQYYNSFYNHLNA